ncbi:hypothetical protein Pmar_PMAR010796 [Perkinsus marinus ATCC 50983]|uniref:Uncharacterized protein n=1 Tax=Perkinsus marinus (strain ATCC 50983 / TXsc) TaxID=423536 RepID=C5LKH1_PERM5|nr:hypothetical protein Pmar_PMAR010796 [Perkinsus marinus ATCC 50983]EER02772.1 hypothetical protein Pmar_PMAR010796 [Perkinsus marinus ATCC 50983]|eukprot:XP_002770956.1 hypothetical protein Pmar_PMAR010796 [Perkinsus marinus ATCC 50983]
MSENSAFTKWNEIQPAHGSAEATAQNLELLGLSISEDTRRGYERARREVYEMGLSAGKVIRYIRCLLDVTELNSTSVQKRIKALRTLQKLEGFSTMEAADETLIKQAMQAVSRITYTV